MTIDILIPTYNRASALQKNLHYLVEYLKDLDLLSSFTIIITDNASSDNTVGMVENFIASNKEAKILLYKNFTNIGLKANIFKVLSFSNADYIMFLGDDDYLSKCYLRSVVSLLESGNCGLIIPSRFAIYPETKFESPLDQSKLKRIKTRRKTLINKFVMAADCNQLSGLVYRRLSCVTCNNKHNVDNLYPFMAWAGSSFSDKNYKIYGCNVFVTNGVKKDWGYGEDGLLGDILDNVKFIVSSKLQRIIGEIIFSFIWRDRIAMYHVRGKEAALQFRKAMKKEPRILNSTKGFITILSFYLKYKILIWRKIGRLKSPHLIENN